MEEKEEGTPTPSASATTQEVDHSVEDNDPHRAVSYPSILPSMPQDVRHPDSQVPFPQAGHSPFYSQMPGYDQMNTGYVQPHATYPLPESGGMSAEGILPTSSSVGHPAYSTTAPRSGIPPVHSYPGFGPYQTPAYGYPYGSSIMASYSSPGATGAQAGYASSQAAAGSIPSSMEANSNYGGGARGYPYYGTYSQQYEGQTSFGGQGAQERGHGNRQVHIPSRSRATNPGRPINKDKHQSHGPEGANLFIFHIPNAMTNQDLYDLFKPYGTVLSARIMTEKDTGRGRGFGFISFDSRASAANAINALNGYQIQGKRLKVDLKHNQSRADSPRFPSPAPDFATPMQMPDYANVTSQTYRRQRENPLDQSPANSMIPTEYGRPFQPHPGQRMFPQDQTTARSVPLQEARPSQPHQQEFRRNQQPPGFVPVPEHRPRGSTPVLPPPDSELNEGSESASDQGIQRNTESPSPLADLNDVAKALPDPFE